MNYDELQLPKIVFHRKRYQLFTVKCSLEQIERKEKELCEIKEKMNKIYNVHSKAVLTLVKVLKIVQREHPILIKFFLMSVYFASKIQNTKIQQMKN